MLLMMMPCTLVVSLQAGAHTAKNNSQQTNFRIFM